MMTVTMTKSSWSFVAAYRCQWLQMMTTTSYSYPPLPEYYNCQSPKNMNYQDGHNNNSPPSSSTSTTTTNPTVTPVKPRQLNLEHMLIAATLSILANWRELITRDKKTILQNFQYLRSNCLWTRMILNWQRRMRGGPFIFCYCHICQSCCCKLPVRGSLSSHQIVHWRS